MRYDVAKETLLKFDDTMLAKLISEKQIKGSNQEPLFIDRNGERFQYILDWYRDGRITLPKTIAIEAIKSDALFFGLPENAIIEESNSISDYMSSFYDTSTRLDKMKSNLGEMKQENLDKSIEVIIEGVAIWIIREMLAKMSLEVGIPDVIEVTLRPYDIISPFKDIDREFVVTNMASFVPAIQKIFANLGDENLHNYLTSVDNSSDTSYYTSFTVMFTFSKYGKLYPTRT
jgi:hypothetical protein